MLTVRCQHSTLAVSASLAIFLIAASGLAAVEPTSQSSGTPRHYFPSLHSRGATSTDDASGSFLTGMEGFGDSIIDLQDRSGEPNRVEVRLRTSHFRDVVTTREMPGRLGDSVVLNAEQAITIGRYIAVLNGRHPFGAAVRTEWNGGAASAYEAPPPSKELILPLMVRNVFSHTTIYILQNTSQSDEPNEVELWVFDNLDGTPLLSYTAQLPAEGIAIYDTWFDDTLFGDLPLNAAGGSIYSLRVSAQEPVALMAYGDEMSGDGTAAYGARPNSQAAQVQYLPAVRANFLGDSLIAITNPSMSKEADVSITYYGAEPGIAGRGEQFTQQFQISERGAAFIDMSPLGRGNQPSPVPRGGGTNRGFFGSAVIQSSGPVLASVQEEARHAGVVRAIAAYNALGPGDLSTQLAAPRLRNPRGGRTTYVVLQNPGSEPAEAGITYLTAAGGPIGSESVTIPAESLYLVAAGTGVPEESQLAVTSNRMIGGLVYETTLGSPSGWGRWGLDTVVYPLTGVLTEYETPTPAPATDTPTSTATFTATATRQPTPTPSQAPTDRPDLGFSVYMPFAHRAARF